MSGGKIERLDLAPKRTRPLSLWNPVDYLVLLYWSFFFPQALRWYVERFGQPGPDTSPGNRKAAKAFREDPIQRLLAIQALVVVIASVLAIAFTLDVVGVPVNWGGVAMGVAVGVAASRLLDWLIAVGLVRYRWPNLASRMVWLPIPLVRQQLEHNLEHDWDAGVHNLNQVLAYSLQFIPAVAALNSTLARSTEGQLLSRTAALTSGLFDWQLLRFGSASLKNQIYQVI